MTPAERKRRYDNSCCRSNLQDAIRSIRKATTHWPFVHADGLAETLEQLKARIKGELTTSPEPDFPNDGSE